jgi:hypothetical protein
MYASSPFLICEGNATSETEKNANDATATPALHIPHLHH